MKKLSELVSKENFEARCLQIELEEQLNKSQGHFSTSFERNVELEREMVRIKKNLNKFLK